MNNMSQVRKLLHVYRWRQWISEIPPGIQTHLKTN